MRVLIIISLKVLLSAIVAPAQEIPQILFGNYSTAAEGISNGEVHATLRDKKGFLWVATENGLSRFDGYSFKTYRNTPGDSSTLGSNVIFALAEDAQGYLWVGTANGLYRYDPQTDRFQNANIPKTIDSIPYGILHIYIDKEEALWMGALTPTGLLRFDTKTWKFDRFLNRSGKKMEPANLVNPGFKDTAGFLWVTTNNGFFKFHPTTGVFEPVFRTAAENEPFRDMIFTNVLQDKYRENVLWLTTWGDGLWKYDKISRKVKAYLPSPEHHYSGVHNVFTGLAQPNPDQLWLVRGNLTVFDILNEKFSEIKRAHEAIDLKIGTIKRFYVDSSDNYWLSGQGGFARISSQTSQFGLKSLPASLTLRAIYKDTVAQKIYFGTVYFNRSLVILDEKTGAWETIRLPLLDKMNCGPRKLIKDKKNGLWFTTNRGLFRFDIAKRRLKAMPFLFENGEHSFNRMCSDTEQDSRGNIYFLFDNQRVVKYNFESDALQITPHKATVLSKSDEGHILLGAPEGITVLNDVGEKSQFIPFPSKQQRVIVPFSITIDQVGRYWMGTYDQGLFVFVPGAADFVKIGVVQGMPSEMVYHLACDPNGKIWAATNQGLAQIDPNNFEVFVFKQNDGLFSEDLSGGFINFPNGEAFIALDGTSLYHHFDLCKIAQPEVEGLPFHFHSLHIEGREVRFEKDINYQENIALRYPDNAFSVEFAALAMNGQRNIRYAYRLVGIERDWTDDGGRRFASYSNLPPGEYRLEVRIGNRSNHWSSHIHSLGITVLPAWWQRGWVRLLALLIALAFFAGIIAGIVRRRLHKRIEYLERQRELEEVRRRIAQDIHDEAGAGLTKIGLAAQVALMFPTGMSSTLKSKLENILHESRAVGARLNEVLFAINPRYDRFDAVQAWLREWSRHFLEDTNIEIEFNLPADAANPLVPPEVKRGIVLILKEALNNTVKYSHSDRVCITLLLEPLGDCYLLRVEDFGRGFELKSIGIQSNGLRGMQQRASAIGATLNILSSENQGALVEIKGPVGGKTKG